MPKPFGTGNRIYDQNGGPAPVYQQNQGPREQLPQKNNGRFWNLFGNAPSQFHHQPQVNVVRQDPYYPNAPINHRIRNIFFFIFVSVPLMAIAELPPIFIFAVTAYCLITINRIAKEQLPPPPPNQYPPPYIQQPPFYPQQQPFYPQPQPPLYPPLHPYNPNY